MAVSRRTWNRAFTLSVGVHVVLFAGLIALVWSAKSPSEPHVAPIKKGLAKDPLAEGPGDEGGAIFLAPRRSGPKTASPILPAIYTEPITVPSLPPKLRPVVAIEHVDSTAGLVPRKLAALHATPLEPLGGGLGSGSKQEGSGGGTGGNGTKNFFAVGGDAKRIVFVLDASSSMGQTQAWHAARQELVAALAIAKADTRCKIVLYSGQPRLLLPARVDWLNANADRAVIAEALNQVVPEGRTEHGPALRFALALRPDAICFLTDADDLTQDHLREVQMLNREGVPIHTIELTQRHRDRIGMPMQVLARRWGGVYQAVDLAAWKQHHRD